MTHGETRELTGCRGALSRSHRIIAARFQVHYIKGGVFQAAVSQLLIALSSAGKLFRPLLLCARDGGRRFFI